MARFTELNIHEVSDTTLVIGGVAVVVLGILYCFAGYKIFRLLLALTGFVLAGCVALMLVGWFTYGRVVFMVAAGIVGGIAGGTAFYFVYRAGVFCLGLLAVAIAAHNVLTGRPEAWAPWAVLGAAVLGGLVALWLERPVMVIATSAIGAWLAVHGVSFLVGLTDLQATIDSPPYREKVLWAMLSCWIALTLAGAVTQFVTARSRGGHKPAPTAS